MTKKKSRPKKPRRAKKVHLKPRVLRFVEEYLLDLNGAAAAQRAGYSKKSARQQASTLLTDPEVQEAVRIAQERRSQRTGITQDRVLYELEHCAFSTIEHYVVNKDGYVALADGAPKDAMRAIAGFKRKYVKKSFDSGDVEEFETELKLWDKPFTLKLAGRHVGLFPDRLEVTGKNGKPIEVDAIRQESDEELKARTLALLAKL